MASRDPNPENWSITELEEYAGELTDITLGNFPPLPDISERREHMHEQMARWRRQRREEREQDQGYKLEPRLRRTREQDQDEMEVDMQAEEEEQDLQALQHYSKPILDALCEIESGADSAARSDDAFFDAREVNDSIDLRDDSGIVPEDNGFPMPGDDDLEVPEDDALHEATPISERRLGKMPVLQPAHQPERASTMNDLQIPEPTPGMSEAADEEEFPRRTRGRPPRIPSPNKLSPAEPLAIRVLSTNETGWVPIVPLIASTRTALEETNNDWAVEKKWWAEYARMVKRGMDEINNANPACIHCLVNFKTRAQCDMDIKGNTSCTSCINNATACGRFVSLQDGSFICGFVPLPKRFRAHNVWREISYWRLTKREAKDRPAGKVIKKNLSKKRPAEDNTEPSLNDRATRSTAIG